MPGYGRVKLKDLAVFSRQFATMINSSLSLLRALTILGEQTANKRLAQIIVLVRAEVEKGVSLSAAMAKHPKVFNRLYVSMVRAGEVGGFLDQVLVKVAETFEKEVALRGKIKSAMTYPVVVFVMVLGIVGETANNAVISRAVGDVQDWVDEGESLALPLSKHATFPPRADTRRQSYAGRANGGGADHRHPDHDRHAGRILDEVLAAAAEAAEQAAAAQRSDP